MGELRILGTHILYPDNGAGLPHEPTFATYCIIPGGTEGEYMLFFQARNYWSLASPHLFKSELSATMAAIRHHQQSIASSDVNGTVI